MERGGFALDFEYTPFTEHSVVQTSDRSIKETHTQRLLQVDSELLTLASRINQDVTLDVLLSPRCQSLSRASTRLIEDVVHTTRKFLDVPDSMASSSLSQSSQALVSSTEPSSKSNSEP